MGKKIHPDTCSRRILWFMVFFIFLFSVYGCSGLIKPKEGAPKTEIYKGTEGIVMAFLKNAPPDELIMPVGVKRVPFEAGAKIENKGAHDIKEGHLLLTVEKNYMEIMRWQTGGGEEIVPIGASGEKLAFKLKGKSEMDPVGQTIVPVSDVEALQLEKQSITHTSAVSMTACYDYETTASARVCIDTDVYGLRPVEKTCAVKEIALTGGQGAPVAVDKIEVNMLPEGKNFVRPQFIIHISNKGKGIVFRPDRVREACSATPLKAEELSTLNIYDAGFSGYSLRGEFIECTPNPVKLRENSGKVVCTTKGGVIGTAAETYETLLQVTLSYGYSQTISKKVKINRP